MPGEVVLLAAVEAGQVALQEALQLHTAARHSSRGNLRIGQQRLGPRVFEQGHPCLSPISLSLLAAGK
jgi:hypothetical protein